MGEAVLTPTMGAQPEASPPSPLLSVALREVELVELREPPDGAQGCLKSSGTCPREADEGKLRAWRPG